MQRITCSVAGSRASCVREAAMCLPLPSSALWGRRTDHTLHGPGTGSCSPTSWSSILKYGRKQPQNARCAVHPIDSRSRYERSLKMSKAVQRNSEDVDRHPGLFIGGQWRAGARKGRIDVIDPATGSALGSVADAGADDAIAAVEAAHTAGAP